MVQSVQFYQEFLKMYPGAKLLAATSEVDQLFLNLDFTARLITSKKLNELTI